MEVDGEVFLEGPNGEIADTENEAYNIDIAARRLHSGGNDVSAAATYKFMQDFLNRMADENAEPQEDRGVRIKVATSTLEDWLWRGDAPIIRDMSWHVYAMWVYRVEKPAPFQGRAPTSRWVEAPFSEDYVLHRTHVQRFASEPRVPMFEGFTMPPSTRDSETAALYKHLRTRPLSVSAGSDPVEARLRAAFEPLCQRPAEVITNAQRWPEIAFSQNWQAFSRLQREDANEGRRRLLARYEYPSIWETQEVFDHLVDLAIDIDDMADDDDASPGSSIPKACPAASADPDADKPRATVQQYTALIGEEVAYNLEGLARARVEKHKRMYQTDQEIHQQYVKMTTGGGEGAQDDGADDVGPDEGGASISRDTVFPMAPWNLDMADMTSIIEMKNRTRLTKFTKELLNLPCMAADAGIAGTDEEIRDRRARELMRRSCYTDLCQADTQFLMTLRDKQFERLEVNMSEDNVEQLPAIPHQVRSVGLGLPSDATFSSQNVYGKPSEFIRALMQDLPSDEALTREQTLFMAKFANACDQAHEDLQLPPADRRPPTHLLLLGQGGSGKTYVVQKIVFAAVNFIWPEDRASEPTLMVVAASNAQAKNISTARHKARTLHNASCMRVQSYALKDMRPGNKQDTLTRLWSKVVVLVVEEVSMVGALLFNMLSYRSTCGRSVEHCVTPGAYMDGPEGGPYPNAFGRCPIVLLLGDFLQLPPTNNVSVAEDLLAKDITTGQYIRRETPSLEVQYGCKLFKAIPHVFELHGTKRFIKGDPLGEFLTCMRRREVTGLRFPPHVWSAFQDTFANDECGRLDPRHSEDKFRNGFGVAMYWETLARWIPARAKRDAAAAGVPMVCIQMHDECNSIDRDEAMRVLNVPNLHRTGDMHGVSTSHKGMRVRLTKKLNSSVGLVQDQTATIVDYAFADSDRAGYGATPAGQMFHPRFLPMGIWLQVDNFTQGVLADEILELVAEPPDLRQCDSEPGFIGPRPSEQWWEAQQSARARGLFLLPVTTDHFKFLSRGTHPVKRSGFAITHAAFHTSTSVQGHTIRTGLTIDCGRISPSGPLGMSDESWWFHLYVMFSRATCMRDMLLLRPPPKELLERGPPRAILHSLERFIDLEQKSVAEAEQLCKEFGIVLPVEVPETVVNARRRITRKESIDETRRRPLPFVHASSFAGRRVGYHFKLGQDGLGYYPDPQVR